MGTKLHHALSKPFPSPPPPLTCFCLLLAIISLLHLTAGSIEYHPQYRILSDPYTRDYYHTAGVTPYTTYNTHPYTYSDRYTPATVSYKTRYTSSPIYTSRYVQPVRSYSGNYYDDDKVYITDKYGNTRVTTNTAYQRQAEHLRQQNARSGKYYRYVDVMTNSYREGMVPLGTTTCTSHTCGSNAQCSVIGGRPVCSCYRGYTGDPLHHCARAECLDTSECRTHQTCVQERCVNVCEGACGAGADCDARAHVPVCSCPGAYTGDPFKSCRRFDPEELCHPSPCGQNTLCEVNSGVPTCKCLPGYHGSPLAGCRHECDADTECGSHQACVEFKCQNPCLTQCGINAECEGVRDSRAICKCPRGYHGSPYSGCQAECTVNSDCPRNKPACFYNECKDPCEGVCGIGANCELRDVTPICSCPRDMTGDPFVRCRPFEKRDLCDPNPCGINARCEPGYDKYNEERPVCTCLPGHTGDGVRGCQRAECTEDAHCADHQGCIDYKCQNPCIGQCGSNANCNARRHVAVCTCPAGYNGDALVNCYAVTGTAVGRRFYRRVLEQAERELEREFTDVMAQLAAMETSAEAEPEVTAVYESVPQVVAVLPVEEKGHIVVTSTENAPEANKTRVEPDSVAISTENSLGSTKDDNTKEIKKNVAILSAEPEKIAEENNDVAKSLENLPELKKQVQEELASVIELLNQNKKLDAV